MIAFPKLFSALNRTGAEFLFTELDLALTFMQVADASRVEETERRNHQNARCVYDTVLALLPKVRINDAGHQSIKEKLKLLKKRLEAVGEQF